MLKHIFEVNNAMFDSNPSTPEHELVAQIGVFMKEASDRLTLEGRKRVFEDGKEVTTRDITEPQDPEEFTRSFLINRILFEAIKVKLIGTNRKFRTPEGERKVDYAIGRRPTKILIEAKPINADLKARSKEGAVNQISGIFTLAEVNSNFSFGIATDGLHWIFIGKSGEIIDELDIRKDAYVIKKYLLGEVQVAPVSLEEISEDFYKQYNDILHGVDRISKSDSLVNSIIHVDEEEDREEIAQILVNRLIFIRFLQSVGLVSGDVLEYLRGLEQHDLNQKLRQLFFEVMSTRQEERRTVDPHFSMIPYLNGSLFQLMEVERRHPEYVIKAETLRYVIDFLSKFRFAHIESLERRGEWIDPEILGYIFEKSMTASDRKGTGSYYTPREVTQYISVSTLTPVILNKMNHFLRERMQYRESELVDNMNDVLILPATTLNKLLNEVVLKTTVCDNACGSGAFLLAAGKALFTIAEKINEQLGRPNTPIDLKKRILKLLYGVDINPRAIEIARLRLWLWLVESYTTETVEPLPNIEYNLEVGNSLVGYTDIEPFATTKVNLDDYSDSSDTTRKLSKKFLELKTMYESAVGDEARRLRSEIEIIRNKLRVQLDNELFAEVKKNVKGIKKDQVLLWRPFHWGFEFFEIFDPELQRQYRGFDIVIGNPPYVDSETMVKLLGRFRNFLSSLYMSTRGNWDLYIPFFERAINLTNSEGMVCFISPNKWLVVPYGKALRKSLGSHIIQVCRCDEIKVFKDAGNNPLITFFTKNDASEAVAVHYFDSGYTVQKGLPVPRRILDRNDWGLLLSDYRPVLLKLLEQDHRLGEVCIIENPFSTSEAYQLLKIIHDGDGSDQEFKFVNTGTIDSFEPLWGKKYTSYIKNKLLHPNVPKNDMKRLMPNRYEQSISPKIIIAGIRFLEAFLDESGSYVAGKSTLIIRDTSLTLLKALCALLNSRLIGFYIKESYKAAGIDGGVNFDVQMIKGIPTPDLRKNTKFLSILTEHFEKINECVSQSDTEEMFKAVNELDKFVYRSYGLSEKEVDLITHYKVRSGEKENLADSLGRLKGKKYST